MAARGKGKGYQGMNWIRQEKRLAIYLRDGLACVYCGAALEDGAQLTLDHLLPHSQGGGNEASNLVTACKQCNSSRGNRPVNDFVAACAAYLNHDVRPEDIMAHIGTVIHRPLPMAEARELRARRRAEEKNESSVSRKRVSGPGEGLASRECLWYQGPEGAGPENRRCKFSAPRESGAGVGSKGSSPESLEEGVLGSGGLPRKGG